MKRKLVLKKHSVSNLRSFKIAGGTGEGNSLDDETNQVPTGTCVQTQQQQNGCRHTRDYPADCSAEPWKCMVDPPTHP
ncbi:hypothetical protein [uncultured Kordia sp.]|uniref:hypothetical protein n=1 Tax=uncultured Kordia sp. TaxID=507699 RepID=UPI00263254BF|nr:hypothetical protein [uncultured Kordia sp.]